MTTSLADAHRAVERIVWTSRSSFTRAMCSLPAERRRAMFTIYAFCRVVDDIADGDDPPLSRLAQLADWRSELDRIVEGRPTRPLSVAVADVLERFDPPVEEFHTLLTGMEMDAAEIMVRPPLDLLRAYCRRVAGATGLLSVKIFGANEPEAKAFAIELGEALQLTNVLRDLDEDASRGRLYLPDEVLAAHGIHATVAVNALEHPALPAVCRDVAALAAARFAGAQALVSGADKRKLRPAVMMMDVYHALLLRLCRRGWAAARRPVRLPIWEKTLLAFRRLELRQ